MSILTVTTRSPEETMRLAEGVGRLCRANDVLALQGTLGAGKTCFVKGLARGLDVPSGEPIISPTFMLLREYHGRLDLFHFDAYRLQGADEMDAIGADEVFASGGVSVVEWADHVAACLPEDRLVLRIKVVGPQERELCLEAVGNTNCARLAEFRALFERRCP